MSDYTFRLVVIFATRIHVPIEPREVAARDLESNPITRLEVVPGRHWLSVRTKQLRFHFLTVLAK